MNDLKEDIKILENMLNTTRTNRRGNREIRFEVNSNYYKALENLLKAYKEDEAVIEEMAEYIGDLDIDEDICKKRIDDCYVDIYDDKACKDCVKEYFRNKARKE